MIKKNALLALVFLSMASILSASTYLLDNFDDSDTNANPGWGAWMQQTGLSGGTGLRTFISGLSNYSLEYIFNNQPPTGSAYNNLQIKFNNTNLFALNGSDVVSNISFWFKGSNCGSIRLVLYTGLTTGANGYQSYAICIPNVNSTWKHYVIPFSLLVWTGGTSGVFALNSGLSNCNGFKWESLTPGQSGAIFIDNVQLNGIRSENDVYLTNINPALEKSLVDDFSSFSTFQADNRWGKWTNEFGGGKNEGSGTMSSAAGKNGSALNYSYNVQNVGSFGWNHLYLDFQKTNDLPVMGQSSVSFWYKQSSGANIKLLISTPYLASSNGNSGYVYNLNSIGTNWTFFNVPFSDFTWNGTAVGKYELSTALKYCIGIKWEANNSGESASFWIDDLYFVGSTNSPHHLYAHATNTNAFNGFRGIPSEIKAAVYNNLVDLSKSSTLPSINFSITSIDQQEVFITIYNTSGRKIRELVKGTKYANGNYPVVWDLLDDNRNKVSSGVYLVQFTAGSYKKSLKVMVIR